jgi:hypothetical protein
MARIAKDRSTRTVGCHDRSKTLGIHQVSSSRRRKERGGMNVSHARRLKELKHENAPLRRR